MPDASIYLARIFDGWEGYNTSIMHAIQPLTQAQLDWRPADHMRSVGELAAHLATGRVTWFTRMQAPHSLELMKQLGEMGTDSAIAGNKEAILHWLEDSWQMIGDTLNQWTVADLSRTIRQEYGGKVFLVSHQWIIWRILIHDVHHGGELAVMLGMQGIKIPELGDLGGHVVWPPLAPDS